MKGIVKRIWFILMVLAGIVVYPYAQSPGDVNNDGTVTIVDALLVAQYYVGLNPAVFSLDAADVNCDSAINIVDALLVAQYYVGLVDEFPCSATPVPTLPPGGTEVDVFGITMFYPTLTSSLGWDSRHWDNGIERTLSNDIMSGNDPEDPTFWSEYRGSGVLTIDGRGMLTMGGSQPRIYINPYPGTEETNPEMFFKNVEVTVYYMRIGTDGANWGGCVIGVRSGPNGHSSWGDYCDATTYYARLRHDGNVDFYKELKHPDGDYVMHHEYWGGDPLPSSRWIGVKVCAYNISGDSEVKLEMYIDKTSGGANGGVWEKAIEYIDDGSWTVPASGCPYPENMPITEGGGVVMIRNTDAAEARYKMFSVREINVR
ncbi:MAG: dockerin type I repeat-containing protein [Spirochaetales bacterium]|nr:dockerin type I repeat-containing protein [Spirochaetales bacterium]